MKELFRNENPEDKNPVSARALYEFLGYNKAVWKRWYMKNIVNNTFAIENEDWVGFVIETSNNETMDFAISIDFAKKLSMQAKTEKGEEARNYFIACEKELKKIAQTPQKQLSTLDLLELTIKGMRENHEELQEVKQEVREIQAKITTRPDFFTIAGYGSLIGINVNLKLASSYGQKASKLCKERDIAMDTIPDPRFGKVRMYPRNILEEVFNQSIN